MASSVHAAQSPAIGELLIELSIALHKFGMYPNGHPALAPVVDAVVRRATRALSNRDRIVVGVANRQLIVDGEPTDADQPALRRLAEDLHRHHVGTLTVLRGIDPAEVEAALLMLSRDPVVHGAVGAMPASGRAIGRHLQVTPLSFDGLALAADEADAFPLTPGQGPANLWVELVRAEMADDGLSPEEIEQDPSRVAHAINRAGDTVAYDPRVLSGLVRIARELRIGTGPEVATLRRRTSRLVSALSPATLRRILGRFGSAAERAAFLHDSVHGMAVEAVLDIVKAAAHEGGEEISHGLLRVLAKLAAQAEIGDEGIRGLAEGALREQVEALLKDWRLDDPNPAAYRALLQQASEAGAGGLAVAGSGETTLDPLRLVQMSLETGDGGPLVDRAIDEAVAKGRAVDLLRALSEAPDGSSDAAQRLLERLLRPATLRLILDQDGTDQDQLDLLQRFMSLDHYRTMLEALATTESRIIRRRLLDRLALAPIDLEPLIVAGLEDGRWFVQRNMLVLLERLGRAPAGFVLGRWTSHADVRVRHQAIRLGLRLPGERDAAVLAALQDGAPRVVHSGLAALQGECPLALVERVGQVASDPKADDQLRVLAVRALGHSADPRALSTLLGLTDGGRRFLFKTSLPAKSPVMLAALRALSQTWPAEPRAAARVALARRAADTEIRSAAQGGARMSDPVRFLTAVGHALAVMALYPAGHPSRGRSIDDAHRELDGLTDDGRSPVFTFLDDEVVFGRQPLRDLRNWDWGSRLAQVGIQRIEVERKVSRDELEGALDEVFVRLNPSAAPASSTAENRQMRSLGIKFGAVDLAMTDPNLTLSSVLPTTLELALGEEAETFRWLQQAVRTGQPVPLLEAEAVVRSLSVAMHGDRHLVLPLLRLKEFDQYTTTHSLNVAVLAMALAEAMACGPREVRAFGIAGLLHDIGKIKIPIEVLTKAGALTPEERAVIEAHPVEGARIIMQSDAELDIAAVVAFEHHIMLDGGGYPRLHYKRECATASRLVHVCDVFDALCTTRPYREAWSSERALAYLRSRAGTEFDGAMIDAFVRVLTTGDAHVRVLHDERDATPEPAAAGR